MTEKELRIAFNSYIRDYGKMIGRSTRDMRQTILLHFTQGVNASDKHWQEKTRWIPIQEKLPDIDHFVLWKTKDGYYFVSELDKDVDFEFFRKRTTVTHWKEIE